MPIQKVENRLGAFLIRTLETYRARHPFIYGASAFGVSVKNDVAKE